MQALASLQACRWKEKNAVVEAVGRVFGGLSPACAGSGMVLQQGPDQKGAAFVERVASCSFTRKYH